MRTKTILPVLFILLALFQLYIPANMVFNQERVFMYGSAYKMQLAPIDPNDPFRGKYILLSFKENIATIPANDQFKEGGDAYVVMKPGKNDFLKIDNVVPAFIQVKAPMVCIKASIRSITKKPGGQNEVFLDYPFTRFYVEESKASDVEERYLKAAADTNSLSYGLVFVYNERVVVKDIIINGESLVMKPGKSN